jgi:hypothetical protein
MHTIIRISFAPAFLLAVSSMAAACPPPSTNAIPQRPAGDVTGKPAQGDTRGTSADLRGLGKYLKAHDAKTGGAAVVSADYRQPAGTSSDTHPAVQTSAAPEWLTNLVPDPGSPEQKAYTQRMKTKAQQEKELKKLRATYFRATKNVEVRQVGITKLREYTDPAIFPSLLALFQGEGADTEGAVLDHLRDLKTDEADASLAWAAVFGKEKPFREAATKRLTARVKEAGEASNRVKWPISLGLRDTSNTTVAAGAKLAQVLGLYEAIPMLINAQVVGGAGPSSRADDGGDAALAYILVGKQQAFVSGLTPVVGDNAVAFNPQLSVLTEGTVLRVIDAVVITYRTEVNSALIGLSTQGWGGQSTAQLGWDQKAWREWYSREFVPYRRKADAELASAAAAKPADATVAPASTVP